MVILNQKISWQFQICRKFASVTTFFIIKYSGILLWLQLLLSHQLNFLVTRLTIIAHLNIPVMRRIF